MLAVLALPLSCGPSEPLPDHFGLFVVEGRSIHELSPQEPGSAANINVNSEEFLEFFSNVVSLEAAPDHLMLYDPEIPPSNLLVTKIVPTWTDEEFSALDEEVRQQIQPVDGAQGMYRVRSPAPFSPGFYVIGGAEEEGFLSQEFRYFSGLCVQCEEERASLITMNNMSKTGSAMSLWQGWQYLTQRWPPATTEQPLDSNSFSLEHRKPISVAELQNLLVPKHIEAISSTDGWGNELEFYLKQDGFDAVIIRSPGSDGKFKSDSYDWGIFPPDLHKEDIVWVDGVFYQYPQRQQDNGDL